MCLKDEVKFKHFWDENKRNKMCICVRRFKNRKEVKVGYDPLSPQSGFSDIWQLGLRAISQQRECTICLENMFDRCKGKGWANKLLAIIKKKKKKKTAKGDVNINSKVCILK